MKFSKLSIRIILLLTILWNLELCSKSLAIKNLHKNIVHSGAGHAVGLEKAGSTDLLRFQAHFTADGSERACWDFPCRLDLSQCAAVRLRIRCLNTHLASQLCIYIQTPGGWQRALVIPRSTGHWEDIVIPKSDFIPENDANASWKECLRVRLDAWRGAPGTFVFHLAEIEFQNANVSLALLRTGLNDLTEESKRREALRFCQKLGSALAAGGVYPAVVDEPDATAATLRTYQCVLLPAAEQTGAAATQQLCSYLRGGGKVAAFYALPPKLASAMELPAGKFTKASSLPRPLTQVVTTGGASFRQQSGAFMAVAPGAAKQLRVRAWWVDSGGQRTRYPAILQSPKGFWMTHVYLNQDPEHGTDVLTALLEELVPELRQAGAATLCHAAAFALANAKGDSDHREAKRALNHARISLATKDFAGVRRNTAQLFSHLADEAVPALAQWDEESTRATELRGVWMQSATGLPGQSWSATLAKLSAARFNTVFPRVLTPYGVAWRSAFAGRLPGLPSSGDPLAECLAAARNQQLKVHAWACLLSLEDAPANVQQEFQKLGVLQKSSSGKTLLWLCPSRKYTHDHLKNLVRELVRNYELEGLQFDMLRYQGSDSCYCDTCKELFTRHVKRRLDNWPECTRDPLAFKKQWEEFRCQQLAQLLQELSETAKAARPRIRLSAAVYPEIGSAKHNAGQEWQGWLRKKLVEFVTPMNYQSASNLFQANLSQECEALGLNASEQLVPGIGVTVKGLSIDETKRQIQSTRNQGLNGFILFEYNMQSAQAIVPYLMR